ncbi:MAG: hypothetical protein HOY78_12930 [Saccharothrix sp.]|nr:hypothetical protein [Saccharothrix sp.]
MVSEGGWRPDAPPLTSARAERWSAVWPRLGCPILLAWVVMIVAVLVAGGSTNPLAWAVPVLLVWRLEAGAVAALLAAVWVFDDPVSRIGLGVFAVVCLAALVTRPWWARQQRRALGDLPVVVAGVPADAKSTRTTGLGVVVLCLCVVVAGVLWWVWGPAGAAVPGYLAAVLAVREISARVRAPRLLTTPRRAVGVLVRLDPGGTAVLFTADRAVRRVGSLTVAEVLHHPDDPAPADFLTTADQTARTLVEATAVGDFRHNGYVAVVADDFALLPAGPLRSDDTEEVAVPPGLVDGRRFSGLG